MGAILPEQSQGFIFKSYADVARDMELWSSALPEYSAIAAVPRSGLVPAVILALKRNIPLIDLGDMTSPHGWRDILNTPPRRGGKRLTVPLKIFVLDDTVHTGATMRLLKPMLAPFLSPSIQIEYGAYMGTPPAIQELDHCYYDTADLWQLMEWSTLHIPFNQYTLVDMDGVLCDDYSPSSELGDWAQVYDRHLEGARCRIRPTYPVRGIVTNRLHKWEQPTKTWLEKNQITYGNLYMNPASSVEERGVGGWAYYKAQVYDRDQGAQLFIESDGPQAREIARLTGKPVLDWSRKEIIQPGKQLAYCVGEEPSIDNMKVNLSC